VDLDCIFDGDLIRVEKDDFFPKGSLGRIFFNQRQGTWCFAPVKDETEAPDMKIHDEIISASPVPGRIIKKRQCERCGFEEITSKENNTCPKCGSPLKTKTLSTEGIVLDVKNLSH
jgi:RNA polymerase subunit RPABC4/transcription elongation factor Spt4